MESMEARPLTFPIYKMGRLGWLISRVPSSFYIQAIPEGCVVRPGLHAQALGLQAPLPPLPQIPPLLALCQAYLKPFLSYAEIE